MFCYLLLNIIVIASISEDPFMTCDIIMLTCLCINRVHCNNVLDIICCKGQFNYDDTHTT